MLQNSNAMRLKTIPNMYKDLSNPKWRFNKSIHKLQTLKNSSLKPIEIKNWTKLSKTSYKNLQWNFTDKINEIHFFDKLQIDIFSLDLTALDRDKIKRSFVNRYNQAEVENAHRCTNTIQLNFELKRVGNSCSKELEAVGYRLITNLGSNGSIINNLKFNKFAEKRFLKKEKELEKLERRHLELKEIKRKKHEETFLRNQNDNTSEKIKYTFNRKLINLNTVEEDTRNYSSIRKELSNFELRKLSLDNDAVKSRFSLFNEVMDSSKENEEELNLELLYSEAEIFIRQKLFEKYQSNSLFPNPNSERKTSAEFNLDEIHIFEEKLNSVRSKSQKLEKL